jgi:hypothetical protein
MRIPTPRLLVVELWIKLYLGEKILLNGHVLVFNLRSERNIIDVFKVKITATF